MRRVALLFAILFALHAHADLELTLATTHTFDEPPAGMIPKKNPKRLTEKSTMTVTLGQTYVRYEDPKWTVVHDFAKRRTYRLERAAGEIADHSLFATLGGRLVEMENRKYLSRLRAAAGIADDALSITRSEHELSLRDTSGPAAKIESRTANGETRHTWKRKELMSWSTETIEATDAERDAFVRFVRYVHGGHPQILEALQRMRAIPKRLRIAGGLIDDATILEITGARRTEETAYAPLSGRPHADDPELEKAIAAAMAATPAMVAAASEKLFAEGRAAADAGKPLEAMLAFMERTLMTGEDLPPEFTGRRETFMADPNVKAFLEALSPSNEQEARAALDTMSRLQLLVPRKAYALGIYKANFSSNLGDPKSAVKDFHAALAQNPLLTGVWKDLGFIHLNGYDAVGAWRCWDAARHIAPQHGMLDEVQKLEAMMLAEHPEYF